MAEDERLREALLELQILRDREADTLTETQSLLECVEAYSTASDAQAALQTIFALLGAKIDAEATLLAKGEDIYATIVADSQNAFEAAQLTLPFDAFSRPRNLTWGGISGSWEGPFDINTYGGTLVIPVATKDGLYALMAFAPLGTTFTKSHMRLAQRLSGLAVRAYENGLVEAQNTLLAAIIQRSSSAFAISDATRDDAPLIYVNEAFERISGYAADEVLGQNCRFLNAEPRTSPIRRALREAVNDRTGGTFVLRNKRKSGEVFWSELSIFPVKNQQDDVQHLVATQTDVTERIAAEQERDRTRNVMEQALETTEDAFLFLDQDEHVVFANDATQEMYPAPDLNWQRGTAFADNWARYLAYSEDMPGRITSLLREPDMRALTKFPLGREIDLPDGRTVLLRVLLLDDGGLVLSSTDVTALKAAQRLLTQRLAAIEATHDGIAISDEGGRLVYLNSAAAHLLDYQRASRALGNKWQDRYDPLPEDGLAGDGTFIMTRTSAEGPRTHDITVTALETGGDVILFRDITDRLATEDREASLKADLQRLHRQQAMAQLTAGIAHDFNNLLSAINGSATLIGLGDDLPESIRAHVDRITNAGTQAARLVNKLLDVGAQAGQGGTFDLGASLSDLPGLVGPSLTDRISLTIATPHAGTLALGDPGELSQVLINLVLNGRDAIGPKAGAITITAERVQGRDAGDVDVGTLKSKSCYCQITVTDNGSGMDAATRARVFEPYFTTKGRKGTGLGLAMVSMQLQNLGGALRLRSTPGEGTAITLFWPMPQQSTVEPVGMAPAQHDLSGLTLIVVDDEPDVADVLAAYLEAAGAEVAICTDPRDAAEAVEDSPDAWSAVLTDYDMPHLNGGALVERIKTAAPQMPVFLITALARRLDDPRVTDGQVEEILAKPVDLEHLCRLLSGVRHTIEKGKDHAPSAG